MWTTAPRRGQHDTYRIVRFVTMQLFNQMYRVILHSLTCEPLINTNKVHIYICIGLVHRNASWDVVVVVALLLRHFERTRESFVVYCRVRS